MSPRGRALTPTERLDREVSGAELGDRIIELAHITGWRVIHHRPLRTKHGWRTGMQGDAGFPDLVLARAGTVLFWEIKREVGDEPTEDQKRWLEDLGGNASVVRPSDWDWIVTVLSTTRRKRP